MRIWEETLAGYHTLKWNEKTIATKSSYNCSRTERTTRTIPRNWDNFSSEYFQNMTNTMPKRITAILKYKGDVTQLQVFKNMLNI